MDKIIVLFFVFIALAVQTDSQTTPESDTYKSSEVRLLVQQKRYEEALVGLEKILSTERAAKPQNPNNLAIAALNVALVQREHYWVLRQDLANPAIQTDDLRLSTQTRNSYQKSIPALLREVISLFENQRKTERLELGTARFELATFVARTGGGEPASDAQEAEVVNNFSKAIEIFSKLLGPNDDQTAYSILSYADHLKGRAEIEQAIPLFEDFTERVRSKHGVKSPYLLLGLRPLALLMVTVDNETKGRELTNEIALATGEPEPLPLPEFDLTRRSIKDHLELLMQDPRTITLGMKKQKSLRVSILIDEKGNVLEVNPGDPKESDMFGKNVQKAAEKEVLKWKFRPYSKDGVARRMRGIVWFPYFIKVK